MSTMQPSTGLLITTSQNSSSPAQLTSSWWSASAACSRATTRGSGSRTARRAKGGSCPSWNAWKDPKMRAAEDERQADRDPLGAVLAREHDGRAVAHHLGGAL